MFNRCYEFRSINVITKQEGGYEYKIHSYSFYGPLKNRYIVYVEEYAYSVFIVKFCLAKHKNRNDRYQLLTQFNRAPSIIWTVIKILQHAIRGNTLASFGFIGTHLPNEQKSETKRFNLYSLISATLASPVNYSHHHSKKISAYLLLNKHYNEPNLLEKVIKTFSEIYNEIDLDLVLD